MIEYSTSIKYLVAGYTVILLVIGSYLLGLLRKWITLKKEFKALRSIEKD